jgi:hypothetical protein
MRNRAPNHAYAAAGGLSRPPAQAPWKCGNATAAGMRGSASKPGHATYSSGKGDLKPLGAPCVGAASAFVFADTALRGPQAPRVQATWGLQPSRSRGHTHAAGTSKTCRKQGRVRYDSDHVFRKSLPPGGRRALTPEQLVPGAPAPIVGRRVERRLPERAVLAHLVPRRRAAIFDIEVVLS